MIQRKLVSNLGFGKGTGWGILGLPLMSPQLVPPTGFEPVLPP